MAQTELTAGDANAPATGSDASGTTGTAKAGGKSFWKSLLKSRERKTREILADAGVEE